MTDSNLTLDVHAFAGGTAGTVELPASVFAAETNIPLIHQVVTAQLAAARQGTHSTKRRGEVSGAGRKPFKQKGTGNARQGSIRAPHMTGGGIVHGPKPRDYSQRTPKKMIQGALAGLLSDRLRGERVHVVDVFADGKPSTKAALALLGRVVPSQKVLVVLDHADELGLLSVRNLPGVHALTFGQLNAYDVVRTDDIVFTKSALEAFVALKTGTTQEVSA